MANKGSFLTTEQSLNAGDYLVAANAQYFAILQSDGNFVIYQGSDPAHQGTAIWATNTVDIRRYMGFSAVMQSDGNFVLYYGTGYGNTGGARWASNTPQAQGQYFATLRNDGLLVLSHGTPTTPGDVYWDNRVGVVTPQLTILSGNNQTQPRLQPPVSGVPTATFGPLTVTLTDRLGNPLSGQQVTWAVGSKSSSMIITLASTTSTSDSNGNATLSSVLVTYGDGGLTITASSGGASATFNLTVGGLTTSIVSGNNQSVPRASHQGYGIPVALFAPLQLKVVLAATGQPLWGAVLSCSATNAPSGMVVSLSEMGGVGYPSAQVITDSNGIATFNTMNGYSMVAYYASGSFTVVCTTSGGNTVTFNETVSS